MLHMQSREERAKLTLEDETLVVGRAWRIGEGEFGEE